MLTDPLEALAEQNDVATLLTGLAGIARLVRGLAGEPSPHVAGTADDFVHLLMGLACLGDAVERLARPQAEASDPPEPEPRRWLR